jgi:hypothetical protein
VVGGRNVERCGDLELGATPGCVRRPQRVGHLVGLAPLELALYHPSRAF